MTAENGAPPRKPDWVLAALAGLAVASVLATAFFWIAWAPTGPDDKQIAEWRQRSLAACRAKPELLAHLGIATVPYDHVMLETWGCGGDCPRYRLRIHQDGLAELHVFDPADQRGDFSMRIPPSEFNRLALLAATLRIERRGSQVPTPIDGGSVMEVGRDGHIEYFNATSIEGEYPAMAECMRSLQSDQSWVRDDADDAVIVD